MYNYPYGDNQQINLNWIISEIIALHQRLDPDYTAPTFTQIYPFSETQQLNLDWILTELKALKELAPTPAPTDAIDEVGQALIAGAYDSDTQYQKNDYIVQDGKVYRANAATTGTFDPTKWREVMLGDDLAIITRWADATNTYLNNLAASNVSNDSIVAGDTVKDALATLNGAIASLGSDDIANDSTNVSGLKVTNALDTLNGAISDEATARQNADTALNGAISDEATARQNADTALNGAITSLGSDDIANDSTNVSGLKVTNALDTLNGAMNNKMNITPAFIEMYPASGSSHGGYIDFHFDGNTSIDYSTRIMENRSGNIHIYGGMTLGSPLGVGSGGTGNTSVDTTPTANSTKMVTSGGVYSAIAAAQSVASHELVVHSGTTALELGRAIMLVYGKLFLLHGIVTVTTALSHGTVIYDLPSYNYGMANINNNPIVAADNSSYTTVGVDNTNKTLKVTYNGGMSTGRFEIFLMGWIN